MNPIQMLGTLNTHLVAVLGVIGLTAALLGVLIWIAGQMSSSPHLVSWGKKSLIAGGVGFGSGGVVSFVRWLGTELGGGPATGAVTAVLMTLAG